jgi:hypothetical protein
MPEKKKDTGPEDNESEKTNMAKMHLVQLPVLITEQKVVYIVQ